MNLKKSLMTLTLLLPMVAFGGVNLKNGNFYITYTDIIVPGGDHDLEVTRTYNSKSTDNGWFGYGWGSLYETKLMVSADGSVVVMENGSGAQTKNKMLKRHCRKEQFFIQTTVGFRQFRRKKQVTKESTQTEKQIILITQES